MRPLFLNRVGLGGAHPRATPEPRQTFWGSLLPILWEVSAWVGLRRAYPPLSKIDPVSAEIARKKSRYTHGRSKGAIACDNAQYRRTHEILKRGQA